MKFEPQKAPTEYLKKYGYFLQSFQEKDSQKEHVLLTELHEITVSDIERVLTALAKELSEGSSSFDEVLEEYLQQVNAVSIPGE